jgi:hypothetical protein
MDWISESVSKTGDLGSATFWITSLAGGLGVGEVVHLYEAVRDRSRRLEREWRDEFASAFPLAAGSLPPPSDP